MTYQSKRWTALWSTIWMVLALGGLQAQKVPQEGDGPIVEHDPIRVAVRGQPVSLLVNVKARSEAVTKVTLHYTLSRHSAPLKLNMEATGLGLYNASIPASYFQRAGTLFYYIEAEDAGQKWTETTWQAVAVKDPSQPDPVPVVKQQTVGISTAPGAAPASVEDGEGRNWKTIGLVSAGAVGVVIAAVALSDSGSGGGGSTPPPGDDTGGSSEDTAGTYLGAITLCETDGNDTTTCQSNDTTIEITENGGLTSTDLVGSLPTSGNLMGDRFSITINAEVLYPGVDGEIVFSGIVREGTISGTVTGSGVTINNATRTYTGSFTATRM